MPLLPLFLSEYHGYDGPVHVHSNTETPELTGAFLDAGRELGYDVTDTNGRNREGETDRQTDRQSDRETD